LLVILQILLFTNVTNSAELRRLAISGQINGALVTSSLIIDQFQLVAAAYKALQNQRHEKMITKTMSSEILYCLSPEKSITGAFRTFGVSDTDTDLIIARICDTNDALEMCDKVCGEHVPLDRLGEFAQPARIQKLYKVSEAELTVGSLVDAVVMRIAAKDFITF